MFGSTTLSLQIWFYTCRKSIAMNLRLGISMVLICAAFMARAQGDSIVLKSVTVYGLPEEKYLAGSKIIELDSALHAQQESRHLGEILTFQLPLYFRNYGNGMISGISMRGTSPSHTAVLWNGININSFSLGQADFSILPAVAFDDVKVHVGGGSARFGSGAFGGSVLLTSNHKASSPILTFSQEAGSFGRFFTSMKGSVDIGKISLSSSFYHLQSKNDFPIRGQGQRQSHAAFQQRGFIQNLEYHLSAGKKISLNYWYHAADREIQPTIGNTSGTDEQQDYNHRLVVAYEQNNKSGLLKLSGGMVDDKIVYNSSPSEVLRWIASASHQYTFQHKWNLSFSTEWNHIIGKIEEYGGEPVEDRIDIAASVQKSFKRISGSFNIRKPFITHVNAPVLPYVGVDISIFEKKNTRLTLSANGSKNFRAPTLNDRYWQDAGRTDLRPETSHAAEGGVHLSVDEKFRFSASGFYQDIDEWIQWVPGESGVYRPHNVKEVGIKGFETSIALKRTYSDLSFQGRVAYQFTRSVTKQSTDLVQDAIGKQLIYTPVHTGSASMGTKYKSWTANFLGQYSGKRFTEASNSPVYALDPFVLVDLSIGKSWRHKRHVLDTNFIVKNLFDASYQMYSGRAMPGRNYTLKILYQLNSKNQ